MNFICKRFDAAYSEKEKSHVHGLTLYLWHSPFSTNGHVFGLNIHKPEYMLAKANFLLIHHCSFKGRGEIYTHTSLTF